MKLLATILGLMLLSGEAHAQFGWGGPRYGPQTGGNSTPSTITLNAITLSNNSIVQGPSGTVVGTVGVTTTPGGWFYGAVTLSTTLGGCDGTTGADNASFQVLSGARLATSGTVAPGTYAVCPLATQAGAVGSPIGQAETITISAITLTAVTLSNSTITAGPSGTVVGAIGVTTSPPGLFSGSLSLSSSADICNGTNGADNASFQIVGSNLETSGTVTAGSYAVCLLATQAGATGSPKGAAETITVNASSVIVSITVSPGTFAGGSADGTIVGLMSAAVSTGSFSGTFSGPGGIDAARFRRSGNNLVLNGTQAAGSYSITLTGTDAAYSNSPFTSTPITITGTGTCSNSLDFSSACNSQYLGAL